MKNAVNVLSKSPVRFWPWIPCMLASALLAPLRLGWLWVSTNDTCWLKTHCEHKHCWLRMPLVCNSILPVTIVNSDVHLYLANVTKVHNKKPIFLFLFILFVRLCFIVELSPDGTPHLDVSQPLRTWSKQPKTFANDCKVMKTLPFSSQWRSSAVLVVEQHCVIRLQNMLLNFNSLYVNCVLNPNYLQ